jgi:DNA helicase-2/ATP-dependent DNA helicase PcrA
MNSRLSALDRFAVEALGRTDATSQDVEEERRLFYVALTRAQHHVVVTHARKRTLHGVNEPMAPSPYLSDIPTHLRDDHRVHTAGRRGGQLSLFST